MMGRTEPDPGATAECVGETAHGRPVAELIENVATAHQPVSRTAFSPDPEQRYLFVAERSNQQVIVLERESLRPLSRFGRVGDRPGEFYVLHDMVSDPDGNLYTAALNVGARAQKFTNTELRPPARCSGAAAGRRVQREGSGWGTPSPRLLPSHAVTPGRLREGGITDFSWAS